MALEVFPPAHAFIIIIPYIIDVVRVLPGRTLEGHEEVVDDPKVPLDGILHVARALVQIIGDGLDVRPVWRGISKDICCCNKFRKIKADNEH